MIALILLQVLVLLLLLLLSAFFSSAEIAFFALNPLQIRRLQESHPASARRVEWHLASPTRLLSTILIGNTFVNVAVSAVAYAMAKQAFHHNTEAIAIAASLFLLLIFGEIGPKRIAVANPERMAILYAPILTFFTHISKPLRVFLERSTDSFAHLFQRRGRILSEEEFATVVDESGEEGILDEDERAMVRGIIRLEDLKASDVMTPRVDIVGIDLEEQNTDLQEMVSQARVRQILLYRNQLDNAEGFLDVRRYLLDPAYRDLQLGPPPLYVPEACPLDRLLAQFLREKCRAAVVVDEYGGTAGIVTRGDILEEITGDIEDEQGGHELLFEQTGPHCWLMDGQINLEKISEELGIAFEEEGVDRIAGWITARLERLPRPGDFIEAYDARFEVKQMRRNRITLVEITGRKGGK